MSWFKKKTPAEESSPDAVLAPVTHHLAIPHRPVFERSAAEARQLRKGMWVKAGNDIGILTGVEIETSLDGASIPVAQVQLVDDGGFNRVTIETGAGGNHRLVSLVARVPLEAVSQALHDDIPEPRRPAEDVSVRFGYARNRDGVS